MKKSLAIYILLSVGILSANSLLGQVPCQGPDCGADPDPVPFTGIELLIGAGALWGAKKYYILRKKK